MHEEGRSTSGGGRTRGEFLALVAAGGAAIAGAAPAAGAAARADAAAGSVRSFASRPDLQPPVVTVVRAARGTAPGYLFLAPSSGPGQRGPMIVDDAGEVIWFRPVVGRTVMNFRVGAYKGQPVLTWWEGTTKDGLGDGEHVIVDRSYREVARFPAGGGRPSDLHELLLTPRGTALVTSWEQETASLASIGGPSRARVIGGVVQELAIPSARVLFEWRSFDHVDFAESHSVPASSFDYFHVNSIHVAPDGNLIVSARNTWAVYKIDRGSGRVLWRLGGKRSDFTMGRGTVFAWQHDARNVGDREDRITIFSDGAAPKVQPQSRGLLLALDLKGRHARLVRQFTHRPRMLAHALGSIQSLPNGDFLVGWGTEPYFTEYAPDGAVRFDAKLPSTGQNYRTLRFPWVGRPAVPPRLAVVPRAGGYTLYASWNGATEVASWQLRAGSTAGALALVATKPRAGFETRLELPRAQRYAKVTALGAAGTALASSPVVRL